VKFSRKIRRFLSWNFLKNIRLIRGDFRNFGGVNNASKGYITIVHVISSDCSNNFFLTNLFLDFLILSFVKFLCVVENVMMVLVKSFLLVGDR
jgi:hypothetical protein